MLILSAVQTINSKHLPTLRELKPASKPGKRKPNNSTPSNLNKAKTKIPTTIASHRAWNTPWVMRKLVHFTLLNMQTIVATSTNCWPGKSSLLARETRTAESIIPFKTIKKCGAEMKTSNLITPEIPKENIRHWLYHRIGRQPLINISLNFHSQLIFYLQTFTFIASKNVSQNKNHKLTVALSVA